VVSLLLGDPEYDSESGNASPGTDDSFVSRIVTGEESATPAQPPSREPEPVVGEAGSIPMPAPDMPSTLDIQPVLQQEYRLAAPRLNTVNPQDSSRSPEVRIEPMERMEPVGPAKSRGWVLQVISLADKGKADEIADRLRRGGYDVTSTTTELNGRAMTRIRTGPYGERLEAVRVKTEISEAFGLDGFVFRQE
jgi:cell division septation protein DedD